MSKLKLNTNLLDYSDWTVGSGSTTKFNEYNTYAINYRDYDLDPYNNSAITWKSIGTNTGWTAGITYSPSTNPGITINPNKLYRVSTWMKRKVIGSTGQLYFSVRALVNGSQDYLIRTSDGNASKNHYLINYNFSSLSTIAPVDEWRLVVGYILPNSFTGTTDSNYYGKVYDLTGNTINTYSWNFKWSGSTNGAYYRVYTPYNENTLSASTLMVYPRIDLVDGTEPSIATLLSGEGIYRNITSKKINIGGTWKDINSTQINIGGTWKSET